MLDCWLQVVLLIVIVIIVICLIVLFTRNPTYLGGDDSHYKSMAELNREILYIYNELIQATASEYGISPKPTDYESEIGNLTDVYSGRKEHRNIAGNLIEIHNNELKSKIISSAAATQFDDIAKYFEPVQSKIKFGYFITPTKSVNRGFVKDYM